MTETGLHRDPEGGPSSLSSELEPSDTSLKLVSLTKIQVRIKSTNMKVYNRFGLKFYLTFKDWFL